MCYFRLLQFGEYVAEEGVVGGDAVVEVDGDGLFGYHLQTLVVFLTFFDVGAEAIKAAAFGGGEVASRISRRCASLRSQSIYFSR